MCRARAVGVKLAKLRRRLQLCFFLISYEPTDPKRGVARDRDARIGGVRQDPLVWASAVRQKEERPPGTGREALHGSRENTIFELISSLDLQVFCSGLAILTSSVGDQRPASGPAMPTRPGPSVSPLLRMIIKARERRSLPRGHTSAMKGVSAKHPDSRGALRHRTLCSPLVFPPRCRRRSNVSDSGAFSFQQHTHRSWS